MMETIRIFWDHFYFSLVAVAAGLVVLYSVVSGIGVEFSVTDHVLVSVGAWLGISTGLAAILTYRTVKTRRRPPIPYTHSQD
jgi:uncharacterized membrane protein